MPKRKAITRISGLVDSDSDDDVADPVASHDEQQRPTKKARGRPKASGINKTEEQSTATTASRRQRPSSAGTTTKQETTAAAAAAAKKPSARGRPRGTSEQEDDEGNNVLPDARQDQANTPKDTSPAKAKKGGRGRKAVKQVTDDGEFEYTPTGSRQLKPTDIQSKKRGAQKPLETIEEPVIPDSQVPLAGGSDAISDEEEEEETETIATTTSPRKSLVNGHQANPPRKRPTVTFADAEKTPSDPDLRRKLGDMTKKYETLESKHRTLREIGIVEANANFEKIKKQCDTVTNSSNKLIASLKEELAAQIVRSKESRNLQKQLKDREDESNNLQSQVDDLTSELSTAQTEIKTLQTKLAAARNNAASAKTLNVEAPGSAVKAMANRNDRNAAASANTEAAQAAQLAQLKEDLYGDMTGLIIRSVKEREADHLYDCIQTGVNGTLQFKLAVAHERGSKTTASLDTAEFVYTPILDAKRDAALISILPEYLRVEIYFSRQNAAKFYTRVMDSLTKRRIDPEE
ncbi:uncharacterized protein TRUGW13939_01942 [Talaromyces rugulosus]|uniref:Monopolin complex subunit Csm1/Pcs1 C-terminal domain-containing protein n=1 Tax=Talaromyces rugulosus TaxID=121627 RepID=A0A7H8QNV1_TALRU|nr:uncharacterized protein TRUGW13939_01942 [Talaromyces rugulosus]QKX54853.1 hypothetical protein TRUGW13939_01942 [Talaromyces rugulosus]